MPKPPKPEDLDASTFPPILFAVGMHHSDRFRFAIDHSGMGEFLAGLLTDQATAVRDALAKEEEETRAAEADTT